MSTPRTNINRLLELAALLRDLPPKAFDMDSWVTRETDNGQRKATCGMTCCIGGWATCVHPDLVLNFGALELHQGGLARGDEVFAEAFGLDYATAYDLTDCDAPHKTPKAAANAVEAVAADLAAKHGYDIVEVPA